LSEDIFERELEAFLAIVCAVSVSAVVEFADEVDGVRIEVDEWRRNRGERPFISAAGAFANGRWR